MVFLILSPPKQSKVTNKMFKVIADEHMEKQRQKKQLLHEKEAKILEQSIPQLSESVFKETTEGTDLIIENQKKIDEKCKDVRAAWDEFNNEIKKWTVLINNLDTAVKEIGDVRNWSTQIQTQIQTIVENLDGKKQ